LSSTKDALDNDDASRLQISSLEKFGYNMLPIVEVEDAPTEPILPPDDTAASDPVKPGYGHHEETSLEDIEAKVDFLSKSLCINITASVDLSGQWFIAVFIGIGAQSTLRGKTFLQENMYKLLTKCRNFLYLHKKINQFPNFT